MRISFASPPPEREAVITTYRTAAPNGNRQAGGYALDISGKVTDNTAYGLKGNHSRRGQGRTAEEVMQAAGNMDVAQYRDYMTVMSNSMSDEDFAKLMKDGYDPTNIKVEDAVTIVDTIKAQLLKAGVSVEGYTDTLDMDKLTEITGSPTYAKMLVDSFAAEDLPLTEENVKLAMDAFLRGSELEELSEGAAKYMVENELPPDIDSLYLAEHAGAQDAAKQGRGYFQDEMPGYYAQKASEADVDKLAEQVAALVKRAGYPATKENIEAGMWLIEKGVPLTEESFTLLKEIRQTKLPAAEDDLFASIAAALTEGRSAGEARPGETKSIFRRAAECAAYYEERYQKICQAEPSADNLAARRQLEEIRLHMTVEANIKLLKSGFAIDTAPMEEMIDALKRLEEERSGAVFGERNPVDLCLETLEKTREIPYLPAAALGRLLSLEQPLTVNSVYETGKSLEETFKQAGEAYDTMMTAPRADLGDNIHTAFRNVDALLENMGWEPTDENRKAVRSLAYNHMELTEENLLAVKGADKVVQRVVEKMTPAAVLSMIREGVDPLHTSMEELEEYLSGQDTYAEDSEKYSRFLYHLEKNKEITQEEKTSYIGIYRLLRQIEKSDGAAIGKLVDTQAEINFSNLLSAIRTGKVRGVDVSVDDGFGSLKEAVEKGVSIDSQIERAYSSRILEEVRSAAGAEDETLQVLKQLEQPVTADNLLAVEAIRKDGAAPFKKLKETAEKQGEAVEETESLLEDIFSGERAEAADPFTDRASMQEAYADLLEQGESLAKLLSFGENAESLDVRALQLTCKQLHMQGVRAAQTEEYDIPQFIDGELTAVHLKLVHDSQAQGTVLVGVDTVKYGYISGEFSMTGEQVSGFFTGMGEEALLALSKTVESFSEKLTQASLKVGTLQVVEGSLHPDGSTAKEDPVETKDLYRVAGMVLGAFKESL